MKKTFLMKHKYALLIMLGVTIASLAGIDMTLLGGIAFAGVTTTDLTGGMTGINANRLNRYAPIRQRITIPLALQVASDVVNGLAVKAGWMVHQVQAIMVTPSTGDALTANVGIGGATSSFDAAIDLTAVAGTSTQGAPGTDAYLTAGGKYFAADDTIDLEFATVTNPAGDLVVDVIAYITDTNA